MEDIKACRFCFKSTDNVITCSKCKWTHYCSAICQEADWDKHKLDCTKFSKNPYKDGDIVIKGISGNPIFQHSLYAIHYLNRNTIAGKVLCVKISDHEEKGYLCNIIMDDMSEFNVPPDIEEHIRHQVTTIKTAYLIALLIYSNDEEKDKVKIIPLILTYNRKFINKIILRQIKEAGRLPLSIVITL